MELKESNTPFKPLHEKRPTPLFGSGEILNLPIAYKQKLDCTKQDKQHNKVRKNRGYKFTKELWKFNMTIEKAVAKKSNINSFRSEAKFLYEKAKKKEISDQDLPWYIVALGATEPNAQPTYSMYKLQNNQKCSIPKEPTELSNMDTCKNFTIEHQADFGKRELETFPHGNIDGGYCCYKHYTPKIEDLSKDNFGKAKRLYPLHRRY